MGFSSAAGPRSRRVGFHAARPSFSLSYGCILPSSLTGVFPRTLGFSPRLPVSVLVRVHGLSLEAFLGGRVRPASAPCCQVASLSALGLCAGDLPPARPAAFGALFHPRARAPSRVAPSSGETMQRWNLRQLPIAYALRLGLGPGFPRVDDRCPGSLRLSVGRILAALFATHTGILAPMPSSRPSGRPSSSMGRSPTQGDSSPCRGFGSALEPRVSSAQGLSASELLRTLSRVAASEPTSWLSLRPYILPHLAQHSGPWPAVRAVSLSATGLVTRRLTPALSHRAIRSLAGVGRLHAPLPDQRSTVSMFHARLALKLFRGEPAISALDWHFTPTHRSSQGFSTPTGSALRTLLPVFQPGHA